MDTAAQRHFLAVDLDTGNCKVTLVSVADGVPESETLYSFSTPFVCLAGKYFWNIYSIYDEVTKGLAKAGARGLKIESIGINSWSSDFVCVAKDGTFLGLPRAYARERYTSQSMDKYLKKVGGRDFFSMTGAQPVGSSAALQLYAQRKARNPILDDVRSILFISDAIVYMLTGKKATDRSQLSSAGLLNVRKGKTCRSVLKPSSIKAKRFPSLTVSGTKLSRLSEESAAVTGLGRVNVVSVGYTASAVVSALPLNKENACLYLGANAFLGIMADTPVLDDRAFEYSVSNIFLGPGRWLVRSSFPDTDNESLAEKCGDVFRKFQGMTPSRIRTLFLAGPYVEDERLKCRIEEECAVDVIAVRGDITALGNVTCQRGTLFNGIV